MSLFSRVKKFTESPQGKKFMKQAEDLAKDPRTKEKINEARERLTHKDTRAPQKRAQRPKQPQRPPKTR
jgi:hypothetical protein